MVNHVIDPITLLVFSVFLLTYNKAMNYLISKPTSPIQVEVKLPSSKSISNRLLIMSALSDNDLKLKNISDSDDAVAMKEALSSSSKTIDIGHAGTAMRFLTAFFAIKEDSEIVLTGSERMQNRPISELVSGLRELGATIDYLEKPGFPPIRIAGKELNGKRIRIESGISSQYISAILMIGPYLRGGLELILAGETVSSSYIRLTTGLMKQAGVKVEWHNNSVIIPEGRYRKGLFNIEPDWSAASYWFAIAGLAKQSQILLSGLQEESLQGDSQLVNIFKDLGVKSTFNELGLLLENEKVLLNTFSFDFSENPDLVQTLVPYCVAQNIPFVFSGCRTLRIKETDRISALQQEMKKIDIKLDYSDLKEELTWSGSSKPNWSKTPYIKTYEDHRMAMGMMPLCLKSSEIEIADPMVVTKSYPGFWTDIEKSGFIIKERHS